MQLRRLLQSTVMLAVVTQAGCARTAREQNTQTPLARPHVRHASTSIVVPIAPTVSAAPSVSEAGRSFKVLRSGFSVSRDGPEARMLELGSRLWIMSEYGGAPSPYFAYEWDGTTERDISEEINRHFRGDGNFLSGIASGEAIYLAFGEHTERGYYKTTIHRRNKWGWQNLGDPSGFRMSTVVGFARADSGCLFVLYTEQDHHDGDYPQRAKIMTLEGGKRCGKFDLEGGQADHTYGSKLLVFPHAFGITRNGTALVVGSDRKHWACLTFDSAGTRTVVEMPGWIRPDWLLEGMLKPVGEDGWFAAGGAGTVPLLARFTDGEWISQEAPTQFEISSLSVAPSGELWVTSGSRARNVTGYPIGQVWRRAPDAAFSRVTLGLGAEEAKVDAFQVVARGDDDAWVLAHNDGNGLLLRSVR